MKSRLKLQPIWGKGDLPRGYVIEGEVTKLDVNLLEDAVKPLSTREIAEELTILNAKTVRRDSGDTDTGILVRAYAEELAEYPADVVRYVLKAAAKNNKFFPAWAELYEDLEFWGRDRIRLYEAVRKQGAVE